MSFKKTMLAVAAVGAISAINAVPAMALENIFNGSFRLKGDFTNFDLAGGNDATLKSATTQTPLRHNAPSYFYLEQRARIYYTAKVSDDLKLVTAFEIDSRWGDTSQAGSQSTTGGTIVTRNVGGAIEADQVNLETKNVYLDFNIPKVPVNVKAGILPYMDSYKGIFLNADLASVIATVKADKLTTILGWSRAYDNRSPYGATATAITPDASFNPAAPGGYTGGGNSRPGRFSLDVTTVDAKYAVSKDLLVGGTYYLTYDGNMSGRGNNFLHTFGLNAAANFGPATVSAFGLAQTGDTPTTYNTTDPAQPGRFYRKTGNHTTAYAANVAAKVKAGPATIRTSFLYTSGDHGAGKNNKAFQGVNQFGDNQTTNYADAQMTMLMETTKYAANTDRALIFTSSNNNQGIVAGFFGVDYNYNKLFANANLGVGAVASQNGAKPINLRTGRTNDSDVVGTEINAEVGYKLYDNLSASLVGGYVFLGDYYKNTAGVTAAGAVVSASAATPDNPWKAQVVLNYTF